MKLPTINVGIPYGSLRMVNEKQQLIMPCSLGGGPCCPGVLLPGVAAPEVGSRGLKRRTHDVSTAFWFVSNATWPYFCRDTPTHTAHAICKVSD